MSSESAITRWDSNRARPNSHAIAANLRQSDRDAGAIAIVNDSPDAPIPPPWYIVNAPEQQMRFACAAVLAPKPLKLAAGQTLTEHYRIAIRRAAWTPEALRELASGT